MPTTASQFCLSDPKPTHHKTTPKPTVAQASKPGLTCEHFCKSDGHSQEVLKTGASPCSPRTP